MKLSDYRSYMDSIEFGEGRHQRLMDTLREGRRPPRPLARALNYAVTAAACLALVAGAGWLVTNSSHTPIGTVATPPAGQVVQGQSGPDGVAAPMPTSAPDPAPDPALDPAPDPAPAETPIPTAAPGEPVSDPVEVGFALSPAPDPEGSSSELLAVHFDKNLPQVVVDYGYPEGAFQRKLTRGQLVDLLGGHDIDDAPALLGWSGFAVTGTAIYTGEGRLWRVTLSSAARSAQDEEFELILTPGALPEDCVILPEQTATDLYGVEVYGAFRSGGAEPPTCTLALKNGDVGVYFRIQCADPERAVELATRAANQFALEAPRLEELLAFPVGPFTVVIAPDGSTVISGSTPLPTITVVGAAGASADLTPADSEALFRLFKAGNWREGTCDCACDYSLSCPMAGVWYNYHSECGTLNDTSLERSLTLSDGERAWLNALLDGLELPVRSAPEPPEG